MKKKLLSVLLALVMVLTLLPVAAFAEDTQVSGSGTGEDTSTGESQEGGETGGGGADGGDSTKTVAQIEETTYESIAKALEAVDENGTAMINVIADTKEDVTIPEGKTITLNIAEGVTVTNNSGHTITNNGTLTISGKGTVDNVTHQKAALQNNGTATLNGCTFTRSKEAGSSTTESGGNSYYTIRNQGTMTINAPTVVTTKTEGGKGKFSSLIQNNADSNDTETPAKLTITGGTFNGGVNTIKNDDFAELAISGGNFTNTSRYAVQNWNKVEISGGTFDCSATQTGVIQNLSVANSGTSTGNLTITGGTFKAAEGQSPVVGNDNYATGAQFKVTGGTYNQPITPKYLDGSMQFEAKDENGNYTYHATEEAAKEAAGEKGSIGEIADGEVKPIIGIRATGFIWDMDDNDAVAEVAAAGGNKGDDWQDQTMWIVFDQPLPSNTNHWFDVELNGKTYGIAASGDGIHNTFAFSFLNPAQWENPPTELLDANGLKEGVTIKTAEITVYQTEQLLTAAPTAEQREKFVQVGDPMAVTVPAKPTNANPNLKITSVASDYDLYAKVEISGMDSSKVYAVRLADSTANGNMVIIILENQSEAYALYCKADQKIWVFEYNSKENLKPGVSEHTSMVYSTAQKTTG